MLQNIEIFEIVAGSDAQAEDEGFWFQFVLNNTDIGAPRGPFPSMAQVEAEIADLWIA